MPHVLLTLPGVVAARCRRHKLLHRHAFEFGARVAEKPFRGYVGEGDAALRIDFQNGVRRGLYKTAELTLSGMSSLGGHLG